MKGEQEILNGLGPVKVKPGGQGETSRVETDAEQTSGAKKEKGRGGDDVLSGIFPSEHGEKNKGEAKKEPFKKQETLEWGKSWWWRQGEEPEKKTRKKNPGQAFGGR